MLYNDFDAVLKEYNSVEVVNLTDKSDEHQSEDMQKTSVSKPSQNCLILSVHKNPHTGDSEDENLISFICSLCKFLQTTDISIVLNDDKSDINLNEPAAPCSSEHEHKLRQGFDERISLSLSDSEQADATHTDRQKP